MTPLPEVRAALAARLAELPEDDVRLVAAIVAELPVARLVATCEAETDRGIQGETKITMPPTSRRTDALGALLAALDRWRVIVGLGPRAVRGVEGALRQGRRRWMSSVLATGGGKDT